MDSLCFKPPVTAHVITSSHISARAHPAHVSALARGSSISVQSSASAPANLHSSAAPIQPLWPAGGERGNDGSALEEGEKEEEEEVGGEEIEPHLQPEKERRSWVLKILQIRSLWSGKGKEKRFEGEVGSDEMGGCGCGGEECRAGEGDWLEMEFDRESFSRLLRRVSLVEAKVYAQMSYLGILAYSIPEIKPRNLLKSKGLHFVTSSLEKTAQLANAEKEQTSSLKKKLQSVATEKEHPSAQVVEETGEAQEVEKKMNNGYRISASAAYQVAASAASYLHSQTRSILSFRSTRTNMEEELLEGGVGNEETETNGSEVASFVATTNSVTAVVAGKEEMKQAVAKDLNSACSSPCDWFICDDESCGTRFFVIQGSESLGSWQVNLLFEPIQFEGLDVLVHRGIYEAAKGIYEQILPEVRAHLRSRGNLATLRFTGHSLGGSLSVLCNLMLLIRGEVPFPSLLPVITFGSPFIMCGGDRLLCKLGLPESHVQAIVMHRDIVPRAFSCSYPDRVVEILKAVNRNFRNYPCLINQKILYAPMGKLLILQPEEKFSPHHDLLPSGSGLYLLGHPLSDSDDLIKQIHAAKATFLNTPHPLEVLSDRSAYGANGAITKNHEMKSYLQTVQSVIHQELRHIRKVKREQRRKAWWPLVAPHSSTITDQPAKTLIVGLRKLIFF